VNLWDFIKAKMTNILIPKLSDLASASRPDGRPRFEVSRPGRSTDVHRTVDANMLEGRPTDPVDRPESSAIWKCPGRPAESLLSVPEARSTGRSTEAPTVRNLTVGGRPAG